MDKYSAVNIFFYFLFSNEYLLNYITFSLYNLFLTFLIQMNFSQNFLSFIAKASNKFIECLDLQQLDRRICQKETTNRMARQINSINHYF